MIASLKLWFGRNKRTTPLHSQAALAMADQARLCTSLFITTKHSIMFTITCDRACRAVVIALRFGSQGPGFEAGLFHKACYMPLHGC